MLDQITLHDTWKKSYKCDVWDKYFAQPGLLLRHKQDAYTHQRVGYKCAVFIKPGVK